MTSSRPRQGADFLCLREGGSQQDAGLGILEVGGLRRGVDIPAGDGNPPGPHPQACGVDGSGVGAP